MRFKKDRVPQALKTNCPRTGEWEQVILKSLRGFSWLAQTRFEQTYDTVAERRAVSDYIIRGSTASQPNNARSVFPTVQSVLGSCLSDVCLEGYRPILISRGRHRRWWRNEIHDFIGQVNNLKIVSLMKRNIEDKDMLLLLNHFSHVQLCGTP